MLLYSQNPPEEASIHTAEMTAIKTAMRKIKEKRRHEMGNIYRIFKLNAGNRENHSILNLIYWQSSITRENGSHYAKSLHTHELKTTKQQNRQ